MNTLTVSLF